ncbi:MAG TPA: hypothetical protein VHL09_06745, partial [Dehalococcoidia bacterium]|nr:hypothetical protein [Dehalococcoidia bacterium]
MIAGLALPPIALGVGGSGGFFAVAGFCGLAAALVLAGYRESAGEIRVRGAGPGAGRLTDLLREGSFVLLSLAAMLFSVAH